MPPINDEEPTTFEQQRKEALSSLIRWMAEIIVDEVIAEAAGTIPTGPATDGGQEQTPTSTPDDEAAPS